MLQGFVTRDRRKESAKEADQHLVELEQAYAETFPEGAGEDGAGSALRLAGLSWKTCSTTRASLRPCCTR